jgi:hypothetical protein
MRLTESGVKGEEGKMESRVQRAKKGTKKEIEKTKIEQNNRTRGNIKMQDRTVRRGG